MDLDLPGHGRRSKPSPMTQWVPSSGNVLLFVSISQSVVESFSRILQSSKSIDNIAKQDAIWTLPSFGRLNHKRQQEISTDKVIALEIWEQVVTNSATA